MDVQDLVLDSAAPLDAFGSRAALRIARPRERILKAGRSFWRSMVAWKGTRMSWVQSVVAADMLKSYRAHRKLSIGDQGTESKLVSSSKAPEINISSIFEIYMLYSALCSVQQDQDQQVGNSVLFGRTLVPKPGTCISLPAFPAFSTFPTICVAPASNITPRSIVISSLHLHPP